MTNKELLLYTILLFWIASGLFFCLILGIKAFVINSIGIVVMSIVIILSMYHRGFNEWLNREIE